MYLLMHVVEKFSSSIFSDNGNIRGFKWIDKMPMPMMKINSEIFTEVPKTES
jgi:hypothetical protein